MSKNTELAFWGDYFPTGNQARLEWHGSCKGKRDLYQVIFTEYYEILVGWHESTTLFINGKQKEVWDKVDFHTGIKSAEMFINKYEKTR